MESDNKHNKTKNPQDFAFTDVELLNRYTTETGKILSRRYTGLSSKQQRRITSMIKRARNMLLMK